MIARNINWIRIKLLTYGHTLLRWLLEPLAAVEERKRRRLRLLSGFLLLFSIQTGIGAIVVMTYDNVLWLSLAISSVLLVAAYIFSRLGYYRITVIFASFMPAITPLISVIIGAGQDFRWLLLPLLLSGIFLSRKFVVAVAGVYFIMVVSQIPFNSGNTERTIEWLVFMFVASVLSVGVASIRQQDQTEVEKQLGERKKAETALVESEQKYRQLSESISDVFFAMDSKLTYTYWNKASEELTSIPAEEALGKGLTEIFPDNEATRTVKAMYLKTMETKQPQHFTVEYPGDTANIVHEISAYPTEDGVSVFVKDVTELRRAEEEIRRLSYAIDQSADGIAIYDLESKITYANKAYAQMHGFDQENIIGMDLASVHRDANFTRLVLRSTKGGLTQNEREHFRGDGTSFPVYTTITALTSNEGNPIGSLAIDRDISERKQVEQEREQLLKELEEKTKELEQIIYVTSHDLRSPLVNIQGFTRELEQSLEVVKVAGMSIPIPDDFKAKLDLHIYEEIPEAFKFIFASISKMDTLLSGLLRLSRLGRAALNMQELDMNELVTEVKHTLEYNLQESGVRLDIEDLPSCRGDRTQIDQVFSNLIGNALKFLDPERPGVVRVSGVEKNEQAVFCVEDNGIGIAPEYHSRIFEIFQRLEPGGSAGEGLGLTIVQRILSRHSGKIWVDSEPGRGSKFYVSLPAAEKVRERREEVANASK